MKPHTVVHTCRETSVTRLVRKVGEPREAAREVASAAAPRRRSTWKRILSKLRLGDKVHAVALPVARAARLKCIDPQTRQLRPDSKCAKRKRDWNGEEPPKPPQIPRPPT